MLTGLHTLLGVLPEINGELLKNRDDRGWLAHSNVFPIYPVKALFVHPDATFGSNATRQKQASFHRATTLSFPVSAWPMQHESKLSRSILMPY